MIIGAADPVELPRPLLLGKFPPSALHMLGPVVGSQGGGVQPQAARTSRCELCLGQVHLGWLKHLETTMDINVRFSKGYMGKTPGLQWYLYNHFGLTSVARIAEITMMKWRSIMYIYIVFFLAAVTMATPTYSLELNPPSQWYDSHRLHGYKVWHGMGMLIISWDLLMWSNVNLKWIKSVDEGARGFPQQIK